MLQWYGISGRKGHGKDTFARLVQGFNKNFLISHFADKLKEIAGRVFGLTEAQMHDPIVKEQPLDKPVEMDLYIEQMRTETGLDIQPAGKTATSPRELMQFLGTEYVRKAQNDYWIQCVVKDTSGVRCALVPDTRFPNEADAIRSAGGKIIKVVRIDAPTKNDGHASETEIDKIVPDLLIGAKTGDLTLPQWIAALVSMGDFNTAIKYDYRGAKAALDLYKSGASLDWCENALGGYVYKGPVFRNILGYYEPELAADFDAMTV